MATFPAFPPPVEHRVVKCRLRAAAASCSGGSFGPPPVIDGQELASDIHALLRLAELAGEQTS